MHSREYETTRRGLGLLALVAGSCFCFHRVYFHGFRCTLHRLRLSTPKHAITVESYVAMVRCYFTHDFLTSTLMLTPSGNA